MLRGLVLEQDTEFLSPFDQFHIPLCQLAGHFWHLCAHHIKLADGRMEILPDTCPPAREGKKSCLSGYIAIYRDTTYLLGVLVAIGCVQVWLGNISAKAHVLFSIAEYCKGNKAQ